MKKETSMIIFNNTLKFVQMDDSEITFTSFVSRDSCFLLIQQTMRIYGRILPFKA